ncbi:FAD binding protein domain protein [Rubellimicrobium mesophilum DSM 19309]|uniref:FAD binding protein domain protein n=1 Tax=Rubellimicrobium mesophilum DSM 19309 TaxID=442562 RepID=A0A017HHU5_9RHOB|nr:FAD-binding oxidoreductase [Rubellimicrobium mesophilum]EYD73900.1 FAD binding protein domain protein [Rubellimicrobium mesophilum DSM 19309]
MTVMGWTRRAFLLGAGGVVGAVGTRALTAPSLQGAGLIVPREGEGLLNDASLLSETPVARHVTLREDPGEALVAALRAELRAAQAERRPVNVGAARHSMGGHAIPRGGHAITYESGWIEPDRETRAMRVHAGARWREVIAALDPLGLSPKVMQSNNDFGVAATFSVNAHGWPTAFGPMGSTVRSLRLVLADGSLVTASRRENPDLFAAAMGGYGLIGLVTEMEVEVEPNLLLEPRFRELPAADFAAAFAEAARAVPMAYGRLSVDRERFFEDALLVTYAPVEGELPAAEGSGLVSRASRPIFRAQVGSDWVKRRRWWIETELGPRLAGTATRNSLLNEPVATLDDRDPSRTDILHEYFVAPDRYGDFLTAARQIIPASYQELLNITLRWVEQDPDSLLAYAPDGPRIASVLLFSQEMTARAEADMARITREMIDAVTAIGGTYYLPYRPHATREQFRRAYPRWEEFVALKRRADPGLRLRNGFWDNYLAEA